MNQNTPLTGIQFMGMCDLDHVVQLDALTPQQDMQPPIAEPPPLKRQPFSRARTAASSGCRDA